MDYAKSVTDNIRDSGWHLQGVFPTKADDGPAFVYSIGIGRMFGIELLCIGNFPPNIVAAMLNTVASKFVVDNEVTMDGMLDIGWNCPMKLRRCGPRAKEDYTIQVGTFFKEPYEVIQVMLCDKHGVYQDDERCEFGKVDMP